MSGAASPLADLLAECDAHGVRLLPADDGALGIDAPPDALTPDLLGRLKAHKSELLTLLQPAPPTAPDLHTPTPEAPPTSAKAVCRCGSTTWRDVPIHDGQSVRRDCAGCRRFIAFPVWHGANRGSFSDIHASGPTDEQRAKTHFLSTHHKHPADLNCAESHDVAQ